MVCSCGGFNGGGIPCASVVSIQPAWLVSLGMQQPGCTSCPTQAGSACKAAAVGLERSTTPDFCLHGCTSSLNHSLLFPLLPLLVVSLWTRGELLAAFGHSAQPSEAAILVGAC